MESLLLLCRLFIILYSQDNNVKCNPTRERKIHIVAVNPEYIDLEISRFLKFARSFVYKCLKNPEEENVSPLLKHKHHSKRTQIIGTPKCIKQVQQTIDYNQGESNKVNYERSPYVRRNTQK